jgi:hypothetical protein
VVSRDSIRIAFLVAALNDLEILSADISGAYLNAKAAEKVYTLAGKQEFGPEKEGRVVVIMRALYGHQSSSRAWRDHMAVTLSDYGYTSCKADPDVWMRAKTKPDGFQYWSYILVYMDDILIIDHDLNVLWIILPPIILLSLAVSRSPISILDPKCQSSISMVRKILTSLVGQCHQRSTCDRL